MKIESQSLIFQSKHEFVRESTSTFEEALANLEPESPPSEIGPFGVLDKDEFDLIARIRIALLQKLLQALHADKSHCDTAQFSLQSFSSQRPKNLQTDALQIPNRFFRQVTYETSYFESESISLDIKGSIKSSSGQEFNVDMQVSMARSFYTKTQVSESVFIDPLIVNIDGELPELSDTLFEFDLDCDGKKDQISQLASGSGFLALDSNENGIIDDGSELFGPKSSDGFMELSRFDEDGNAWIDENDPIFEGLRIWNGQSLVALGEAGVGALYLGASQSQFTYKNENNESLGKLRSSSIILNEDGSTGTLSQVDFVTENSKLQEPLKEALAKA